VPTDSQFYNGGRVTGDVAAGILGIAEIIGGSGLGGGGLAACGSGGGCTLGGPAVLAGNDLIAHGILVTGSGAINLGRDLTNFFAQENEGAGSVQTGAQGGGNNGSEGASAADATRLKAKLGFEEAGILTKEGKLTDEAVNRATEIKISGGRLTNPAVVDELTANGSRIEDWGKFRTPSIELPGGQASQIHFYRNRVTGQVNLNIDFKIKGTIK
jgi:hypothetical protein